MSTKAIKAAAFILGGLKYRSDIMPDDYEGQVEKIIAAYENALWQPIKDMPPCQKVNVLSKMGQVFEASYTKSLSDFIYTTKATHFRPLPLPKEK